MRLEVVDVVDNVRYVATRGPFSHLTHHRQQPLAPLDLLFHVRATQHGTDGRGSDRLLEVVGFAVPGHRGHGCAAGHAAGGGGV